MRFAHYILQFRHHDLPRAQVQGSGTGHEASLMQGAVRIGFPRAPPEVILDQE